MARAGNVRNQVFPMALERRRGVARAGHYQRRTGDGVEPVGQGHVTNGAGTAGIALRVHGKQLAPHRLIDGRIGSIGQETPHRQIDDSGHALLAHGGNAVVPRGAVHRCRSADRQQGPYPARRAQRQFHGDHPAERNTRHGKARKSNGVGCGQHIVCQLRQAVVPRIGQRSAMAEFKAITKYL